MNHRLYCAARNGDTELLKRHEIPGLDEQVMSFTLNTALHIAVNYGRKKFAKELCDQYPTLLTKLNSDGDTPLHVVARTGKPDMACLLISKLHADIESAGATEKLRLRNKDNYTPLHEAVRNSNLEVAKLLTEADPDWSSCYDDDADESLLYLAARTGDVAMVKLILEQPASYAASKGEKALYVAAARKSFGIVEAITEKNIQLIRGTDENGRTLLHYAAKFGKHNMVEKLILKYPYSAFTLDQDGRSPLHIAASKSQFKVVQELNKHCPACLEQLSEDKKSILHFAVESGRLRMVIYVVDVLGLERFLNHPDLDGNTPFHLAAKLSFSWQFLFFALDSRQDHGFVNNQHETAFHIQYKQPMNSFFYAMPNLLIKLLPLLNQSEWLKELKEEKSTEIMQKYKEVANTLGTVETLITTVTFAAALQVPGGFNTENDSMEGTAVLEGERYFINFLQTDTAAMALSLTAMFLILIETYFGNKALLIYAELARILIFSSFLLTGLAFIYGVAAILSPGAGREYIIFHIFQWCPRLFGIVGLVIFITPLMIPPALFVYQSTPHQLRKSLFSLLRYSMHKKWYCAKCK